MGQMEGHLASHPDRLRWNARYGTGFVPSFAAHPLAVRALAMSLPDGDVLDLACGPSGAARLAAAAGRHVTAVDAAEVALGLLADEAARRGHGEMICLVHADLARWAPEPASYALVLCTGYWNRAVFAAAAQAVVAGGLLGWEAFTQAARRDRPQLPAEWCLEPGEPAALLPAGFDVLTQDQAGLDQEPKRRLLARRRMVAGSTVAGSTVV